MNFKIGLFFILSIFFFGCKSKLNHSISNDIQNKIIIADSTMESGNMDEALIKYKNIENISSIDLDKELYYKIAAIYAIKKEKRKAYRYINKGIVKDTTFWILEEPYFYNLIDDKKWTKIENKQLDKIEIKNGKFKNRTLTKKTYQMFLKDQSNYYELEHFENKQYYIDLKNKLNHENLSELDKIIEEYGWPTISKVGIELSQTAFQIVQHEGDIEKQKQYLILVEEASKNNDIKKWNYANLKDRILLKEGNKQMYGTNLSYDQERKINYFNVATLQDPSGVDFRRKELEMESMSDFLKHLNIEWDMTKLKLYPKK